MKSVRVILIILLTLSIFALVYSIYQIILNSNLLSYSLLMLGSLLSAISFLALILSKSRGRSAVIWFSLSIANLVLFFIDYYQPDFLKTSYTLSFSLLIAMLFYAMQQMQDRYKKPLHNQLRLLNYGTMGTIIALLILKVESFLIWQITSYLVSILLILNFVIFLLPSKEVHHSKNVPNP